MGSKGAVEVIFKGHSKESMQQVRLDQACLQTKKHTQITYVEVNKGLPRVESP